MPLAPGVAILELAKRIREINEGKTQRDHPLPVSDSMYRRYVSDIVDSPEQMREFLRLLTEAHYIFTITMVEPDDNLMIDGVYGYVVAEPTIIRQVREVAFLDLEAAHEQQFYRRKGASSVMRELVPQARTFNNTHLGRSLNVALMLQQYENLLAQSMSEFSDVWRRNRLEQLIPGLAPVEESEAITPEAPDPRSQRAVDSGELDRIQQMDESGRWGDAVRKYGVQFLVRIHFRKYEFDRVRWLIKTHKIAREDDLRFIRDTVRLMEQRLDIDTRLERFVKDMSELRRMCQIRLNQIFQVRKGIDQGGSSPGAAPASFSARDGDGDPDTDSF
ncbi:MAG: hypothetical protein K1X75_13815 [Leptospirales bacterium]|nr:hypothetical protein [Leptospirales bacterium]